MSEQTPRNVQIVNANHRRLKGVSMLVVLGKAQLSILRPISKRPVFTIKSKEAFFSHEKHRAY